MVALARASIGLELNGFTFTDGALMNDVIARCAPKNSTAGR
jgi:hypothetical protein